MDVYHQSTVKTVAHFAKPALYPQPGIDRLAILRKDSSVKVVQLSSGRTVVDRIDLNFGETPRTGCKGALLCGERIVVLQPVGISNMLLHCFTASGDRIWTSRSFPEHCELTESAEGTSLYIAHDASVEELRMSDGERQRSWYSGSMEFTFGRSGQWLYSAEIQRGYRILGETLCVLQTHERQWPANSALVAAPPGWLIATFEANRTTVQRYRVGKDSAVLESAVVDLPAGLERVASCGDLLVGLTKREIRLFSLEGDEVRSFKPAFPFAFVSGTAANLLVRNRKTGRLLRLSFG